MAIETAPPLELMKLVNYTYAPPGGQPYRVQDNDDWKSLAKKYRVDVKELIKFNFHTTDPAIVNWYLHWKVGCKKQTKDGLNWMFSDEADPGVIYFPPTVVGLPIFWNSQLRI